MENTEFILAMEKFGRLKNIPKRDVLDQAYASGQLSLQYGDREQRKQFLLAEYLMYCAGFPSALPAGTRSIKEHD